LKGLRMVEEVADHDNSPAPVRQFDLPDKPAASVTEPARYTVTEVETAINAAVNMAALIKAGDMAKSLGEADAGRVRASYREKRNELIKADGFASN